MTEKILPQQKSKFIFLYIIKVNFQIKKNLFLEKLPDTNLKEHQIIEGKFNEFFKIEILIYIELLAYHTLTIIYVYKQ